MSDSFEKKSQKQRHIRTHKLNWILGLKETGVRHCNWKFRTCALRVWGTRLMLTWNITFIKLVLTIRFDDETTNGLTLLSFLCISVLEYMWFWLLQEEEILKFSWYRISINCCLYFPCVVRRQKEKPHAMLICDGVIYARQILFSYHIDFSLSSDI